MSTGDIIWIILGGIAIAYIIWARVSTSRLSPEERESKIQEIEQKRQENINKNNPPVSEDGRMKCPHCNAQIQPQMVQRRWSPISGFFTNKVDRVCPSCKRRF